MAKGQHAIQESVADCHVASVTFSLETREFTSRTWSSRQELFFTLSSVVDIVSTIGSSRSKPAHTGHASQGTRNLGGRARPGSPSLPHELYVIFIFIYLFGIVLSFFRRWDFEFRCLLEKRHTEIWEGWVGSWLGYCRDDRLEASADAQNDNSDNCGFQEP